jgi:hypothetical protein
MPEALMKSRVVDAELVTGGGALEGALHTQGGGGMTTAAASKRSEGRKTPLEIVRLKVVRLLITPLTVVDDEVTQLPICLKDMADDAADIPGADGAPLPEPLDLEPSADIKSDGDGRRREEEGGRRGEEGGSWGGSWGAHGRRRGRYGARGCGDEEVTLRLRFHRGDGGGEATPNEWKLVEGVDATLVHGGAASRAVH